VRRSEESQVGDVLRKHVGRRPAAYVPDMPSEVHRALLLGRSLREAGASAGGAGIEALVSSLGGRVRSKGLMARLSGRA
jgi:hypothetical protein